VRKSDFLASILLFLVRKSDFLASILLFLASKSDFLASILLFLASKSDFLASMMAAHIRREESVKHAIGYLGHYDRSFQSLHPNPREYVRENGSIGRVDERPTDVNGVFFGYMERQGKTFVAVRAQYSDIDVVLETAIPLDPPRHTDGKGFGPNPSRLGDESAGRLLSDMILANPQAADQLRQIASRLGLVLSL